MGLSYTMKDFSNVAVGVLCIVCRHSKITAFGISFMATTKEHKKKIWIILLKGGSSGHFTNIFDRQIRQFRHGIGVYDFSVWFL